MGPWAMGWAHQARRLMGSSQDPKGAHGAQKLQGPGSGQQLLGPMGSFWVPWPPHGLPMRWAPWAHGTMVHGTKYQPQKSKFWILAYRTLPMPIGHWALCCVLFTVLSLSLSLSLSLLGPSRALEGPYAAP